MSPRAVATALEVDRITMLNFVRPRHHFLLSTTRADGRPQMSPVTGGVDPQGRLVVATYPERAKVHNVRHNPAVSVCVLSDDWNGAWMQIDGVGEVVDLPEALELLVEYYRSVAGEHPNWKEYRQAMVDQGKSLLRIRIQKWGPIATGGFPARLADG